MANTKVTTGVIKDDAVGADQLASNAVVTASITDNAVTTAKISDDAILTAKISNSAITNAKMSANSVDSDQYVDASIDTAHIRDGQITSAKLDTNISVSGELTVGSHLNMGDGDILKMGASADLQIYHHSNGNSIISETGSGDLFIQATNVQIENAGGDNMIVANSGGAVNLYYAAAEKLATTSSGVDVTGTATMGGLTVQGTNSGVIVDTSTAYAPLIKPSGALSDLKLSTVGNGGILHLDSSGGSASTIRMTTNGSERMRIDGSGNVGIGTSSPDAKLHLYGSSSLSEMYLGEDAATDKAGILKYTQGDGSGTGVITLSHYGNNSNTDSIAIKYDGNVGIGTTSPTNALDINGSQVLLANGALKFADAGNAHIGMIKNSGSSGTGQLEFYTGSAPTERMRIDSSGNVGIAAVPSGEAAAAHVVRLGDQVCIAEYDDGSNPEQFNLFHNSDSAETYIETGTASVIQQRAGEIIFKNAASGSAGAAISFSERMRIDSSGNVGIGTGIPDYLLEAYNGDISSLKLISAAGGNAVNALRFRVRNSGNTSQYATLGTVSAETVSSWGGVLTFSTKPASGSPDESTTERMRIDSSGHLLVGKTASNVANIGQEIRPNGETFHTIASANNTLHVYSSTASAYRFYVSHAGQIHATSTSITAISDERLKENIVDLETGLSEVMSLQPRRFDWKNGDGENVAGFIAQEVETVLPDLISDYKHEDLDDAKSVRMGDMLPTLVKAIQEQQTQIETLKQEIQELKE